MPFAHRPYRDIGDLGAMKRVLVEGRRVSPHSGYMHVGDLDWRAFGPHGYPLTEIIKIWEDGGGVAGWMLLASAAGFDCQVAPELRGSVLEREIVEAGQTGVLRWRSENGLEPLCVVEVFADDRARIEMLRSMGYRETDRGGVYFAQPLDREIPEPRVGAGWEVRGMRENEVESRATTQFEAFSPGSKTTASTWRHLMANAPGYDADLDNVVVAPDGSVVSAALMWLDTENQVGLFEPVGTRPAHQRQGLGHALMLRGLRTLRERGMTTAIVSTNATNAAAIALYTSVGFVETNRLIEYEWRPPKAAAEKMEA